MDFNSTNQTNSNAAGSGDANDVAHLKDILWNVQVIFLFFTIFAALLGNALVLIATYLDKRLHNANKFFVACLAASDLLVAMFSVTIRLHQYLHRDQAKTIQFCRFWIWVDIFSEAASITTVTVISMDRYYKMSRPFKYKANMSIHRARYIITFIWIYSATLGSLGLVPYGDNKGVHIRKNKCFNENRTFYTLGAILGFFFPVVILIVLCVLIFRIVQKHSNSHLPGQQDDDGSRITRVHQKLSHSKSRSLRTLSLIVITFIICWGPFFTLFLVVQYNPRLLTSMGIRQLMVLECICFGILPYANSFLNPVIYAFFDKTFNAAIKDMLLKFWRGPKQRSRYHTTRSIRGSITSR